MDIPSYSYPLICAFNLVHIFRPDMQTDWITKFTGSAISMLCLVSSHSSENIPNLTCLNPLENALLIVENLRKYILSCCRNRYKFIVTYKSQKESQSHLNSCIIVIWFWTIWSCCCWPLWGRRAPPGPGWRWRARPRRSPPRPPPWAPRTRTCTGPRTSWRSNARWSCHQRSLSGCRNRAATWGNY